MPHTAKMVDDLCFIKSMHTEQINHDPAVTFAQTGFQLAGRPSLGAWVTYGLGTMNQDLPAFVVMITGQRPIAWRSGSGAPGFIPSRYQGIKLRSVGDPVLYISDPAGFEQIATGALHRGSGETEPARIRGGEQSRDQHSNRAV